ncbi:hypothetical protein MIB92_18950 [Aestuariirhabdus sp. Z084]|uniref:BufA2 family periplasmic bufferin-type metallophore n=1 Tax=Aestuariirhabdus haliotis TaxID=2918751 RepID=UPI00201B4200|nr:hypothetical protein [Aestuariirhabdus haliotis]MCL6417744.1 hypothetical protein [Aestuariirhabdus haliotis]MCL6421683.1 hypothetical protein [Aestuariirhabdus haliotis]
MVDSKKAMGIALAVAAAGMLGTATPTFAEGSSQANVKCYGVNDCKGHNDCKTANNSCKGHGSCKGQGFVMTSEKECSDMGGMVKK